MLWEEQGEDEDRSSVFAAEGTVAHFVRDACLTFGLLNATRYSSWKQGRLHP